MKILTIFCLVGFLSIGFFSCDKIMPVNYDKAGLDLMALMRDDASLTISDYKNNLKESLRSDVSDMSSKDFFSLLKMDSGISELYQYLSLDMASNRMKELGIDVENLKRALRE